MYSKFGLKIENFNDMLYGDETGSRSKSRPDKEILVDPRKDPGDKWDSLKWDFPENDLDVHYIDNYPYKVRHNKNSKKRAEKLAKIRKEINRLCETLESNPQIWNNRGEFTDGTLIFLDIHGEYERDPSHTPSIFSKRSRSHPTSKFLISDIPKNPPGKKYPDFFGLNKPKMRHLTNEIFVGPDENIRCGYRDIFLKPDLTGNDLIELLLHELSHTGVNHCRWRDDDHGPKFKEFERMLTKVGSHINFMDMNR